MDDKKLQRTVRLFCQAVSLRVFKPALDKLSDEDLTLVQLSCIRFAHLHPESSVGMIADGLGISNAAAAKLIDRLVKKGLLIREEDSRDRRVLKIKLTETGQNILESLCLMEDQYFVSVLRRMPSKSLQNLECGIVDFLKVALEKPEQVDEICLKCGWNHELDCVGNLRYRELTGKDKEKV